MFSVTLADRARGLEWRTAPGCPGAQLEEVAFCPFTCSSLHDLDHTLKRSGDLLTMARLGL